MRRVMHAACQNIAAAPEIGAELAEPRANARLGPLLSGQQRQPAGEGAGLLLGSRWGACPGKGGRRSSGAPSRGPGRGPPLPDLHCAVLVAGDDETRGPAGHQGARVMHRRQLPPLCECRQLPQTHLRAAPSAAQSDPLIRDSLSESGLTWKVSTVCRRMGYDSFDDTIFHLVESHPQLSVR